MNVASRKLYHFAAKINEEGGVSALCFETPREINLRVSSWTIRPSAVTCPKCKRILAADPSKAGKFREGA